MKNTVLTVFCMALLLLMSSCPAEPGAGNPDNPDNPINPDDPAPVKYEAEFLGEWIRMDTGERWYISGSAIQVNGAASGKTVTLEKTAEQVITVREAGAPDYFLFASRVADAGFRARVVFINEGEHIEGRAARSLIGSDGQRPPVIITNPKQPQLPPVVAEPDPDTGEITVPGQIPGDTLEIVPDGADWEDVKVELTPWADQDMGIIPLARGENLKSSIRMADFGVDISELYADNSPRGYVIEIENIGTADCVGASYELSWDEDDFSLFSGSMQGQLDTIVPGGKKQISLLLGSKPIAGEYKNKEINVTIVRFNPADGTTARWEDTVSVNYYKEAIPFRFRSQKPVQGVIRTPRNKTYYFKTTGQEGDYSHSMDLPWSTEDYVITFLGASAQTQSETKYSLAIDGTPPSDWDSLWGEDMYRYDGENKSADTGLTLDLVGEKSFMYYLYTGAVQYYRINISIGVTLSNSALTLVPDQSASLSASVYPRNTENKAVTWSSDNTAVATVDGSGNVRAAAPGTAKITVTTASGGKTAECAVTVVDSYAAGNEFYVPGTSLAARLAWLQTNAASGGSYTVEISGDEAIGPASLSYSGRDSIGITLVSTGAERVIDLSANGSMFTVDNGVTLALGRNVILRGRSNNTSLITVKEGGTLVMNTGSRVIGNSVNSASFDFGGGVYVDRGTLTMNGGTISGNYTYRGGGVYVERGTFTMNGGTISGNDATGTYGSGGGVYLNGGTFTMNGGGIRGNDADTGGGVYINRAYTPQGYIGATFTMYGGTISGNTAISILDDSGGAVYVDTDGTFAMYGGEISANRSSSWHSNGAGVCVSGGAFTMYGGEISGHSKTTYSSGGGVKVYYGTFTMNGGAISGNSSSSGGGVYADSGTFIMNGGAISGNTATGGSSYGGGGVYMNRGAFYLTGGVIYGRDEEEIIRNSAGAGASLYMGYPSAAAEYGTFSGSLWNKKGDLNTTGSTIRVVNGMLQ